MFARDISSTCSTDPLDDRCLMEIVLNNVASYALTLTHDDVASRMMVMSHGGHWCIQ
jgi:hypothetical protein